MTILNTEIYDPTTRALFMGIGFIIIALVLIWLVVWADYYSIIALPIVVGIVGIIVLSQYNNPSTITHEVVIYDFNEVYEQGYEITSQRGDIYTIKKEANEEDRESKGE